MDKVMNNRSANPRLQCCVCGKWKRQFNRAGERIMAAASKESKEVLTKEGYVADVCMEHYDQI